MIVIIKNTFREALAKKIFIGYYIFYAIIILFMLIAVNLDTIEGIVSLADVKNIVISVQSGFITISFPLILFFSLISVSSFIPSLTEKGTIDVVISKPISRFKILMSKYTGAVLFVALSMLFLFGSIWLILSLKSGYWNFHFLISVVNLTLAFAIMYSITVLIGLMTQSSIISILVNFFLIFVLCPILSTREMLVFPWIHNETAQFIFNFFYYVLPKPGEIKDITVNIISHQSVNFWKPVNDVGTMQFFPAWMSMITSLIFCATVMAYSVYYFSKKDY